MSFRIEISPDQEDVTLHVIGHFDLAVGFAFWQYCEPERRRHKRYLFNLTGVSDLRDSGIGWLLMFSKRARALGAHLTLLNSTLEFEQRCIAAGIPMEACVSPGAKPASMAVRFERDLAPGFRLGKTRLDWRDTS